MKKWLLILIILVGANLCFDCSLYSNSLPVAKKDTIAVLDSLVNTTITSYAKTYFYAKIALQIATKTHNVKDLIRAYRIMGDAYRKNYRDSSLIYYNKALKISTNQEDEKAWLFYNLAQLYKSAQNLQLCMVYLDSSMKLGQHVGNFKLISNIYNMLGNIKMDVQDRENAETMYDSSFNIAKRYSLFTEMGIAWANLARFDTLLKNSIKKQKEALSFFKRINGNEQEKARILINIGYRYNNPDSSLFYHLKGLEFAKKANLFETQMGAYNGIAYDYLEMGKIDMAEESILKGISLGENEKNHDWLSTLYDSYADILNKKSDFKKAAIIQKKAFSERILADQKQSAGQVRLLAAMLDTKNKEIIIQNKENEILVQSNRLQKMRFWLVLAVILIVLTTFIFYWLQQRSRMKLKSEEVKSAKKLIEMEESEKGRLARELHDITGQFVMGITSEIENLEIPSSAVKDEINDKIKALGKSIRQISHRMNRAMLEHFTFEELMSGQCEDVQKLTGIPIFLTMPEKEVDLSREVVTHLHRIVQELLTNAGKYAKEGEVYVEFALESNGIKLSYSDTGPGFDTSKVEMKGMGLMNIYERAKLLGGNATMKSSPGNGTSWDVYIPFSKN